MISEKKDIITCEGCLFYWHELMRNYGKISHCNFYTNLNWKGVSPKQSKPPDCKVTSIVINMD